jgi:CubicO group peptidase (beta-lactamase class C family)
MTLATTQLEDTIAAEMDRSGLTGLAIALVKYNEIVWSNAYGTANVDTSEALTTAMRFSIMSVTKTMIATAMMQLRDEGHFQLDDPANQYLAPARIANDFDAESPVTIRQLMTHTSGLPVLTVEGRHGKITLDEYVNQFARTTRRPGTEIVYANSAFVAMGVLIERFSGMRVDEYLRARIFEPLGMTSARLANPEDGDEHATGHYKSFVDGNVRTLPLPEWSTIPNSPAGGVWSTVEDVAKFVAAHLNGGGTLLSRETADEMHDLHVRQGSSRGGQGLGWRVTRSNGRKLICHGGDGGGFTAFAGAYPADGIGIVLLINTGAMQSRGQ